MFALVLLTVLPLLWFGMVTTRSFIDTPLNSRAPGMTHSLEVGIDRIVFKVVNTMEAALTMRTIGAWTQRRDEVTLPIGIILIVAVAG